MGEQNNSLNNTQSIADYLAQLLKDRKQVTAFPNVFMHVERLIDEGKFYIYIYILLLFVFFPLPISIRIEREQKNCYQ